MLANKNKSLNKKKADTIIVDDNYIKVSDAYSYKKILKRRVRNLRLKVVHLIQLMKTKVKVLEINEYMINFHQKHTQMKNTNQQKSSVKNVNDETRSEEEGKLFKSDRRITENDNRLDKDLESPLKEKAVSHLPKINNSTMSKEVGLDDRTSKLKEDEKEEKAVTDVIKLPPTASKTITVKTFVVTSKMTENSIIFRGGYDKGYIFFIADDNLFVCILIYFNKKIHFQLITKKCKNYKINC